MFPTTMWSGIRSAGAGHEAAVNALVERYRPAVVRFLRGRGLDAASAEDVAQEVFLQLLDDRVLERADRARGRFRSLLLAVTRHVLSHDRERASARKRGGGRAKVPLDELELDRDAREPDFDREFLAALIAAAFTRLERESPDQHRCVRAFLLEERGHKEIAAMLGKSESAVATAISRGRAKLVAILREEVAAYSSSEGEFEAELRYLSTLLPGGPAGEAGSASAE